VVRPLILEAANILGLGRAFVVDIGSTEQPWKIDFGKIKDALKLLKKASIVLIFSKEVITGQSVMGVIGL
jgi:hypothetical protein